MMLCRAQVAHNLHSLPAGPFRAKLEPSNRPGPSSGMSQQGGQQLSFLPVLVRKDPPGVTAAGSQQGLQLQPVAGTTGSGWGGSGDAHLRSKAPPQEHLGGALLGGGSTDTPRGCLSRKRIIIMAVALLILIAGVIAWWPKTAAPTPAPTPPPTPMPVSQFHERRH